VTAGVLQVVTAACLWGTWSLFLRPAAVPALSSSPVLFAVTALALAPLAMRETPAPRWDRAALVLLFATSALDAVNVVTFFGAMDRTTVAVAVLTHYFAPLFIALLAPIVDRERIRGAIVAAAVATVGLALVLRPWTAHGRTLAGGLLGSVSALAYGANVFVVGRLAARVGPARAIAWHAVLAAVLLVPFADLGALRATGGRAVFLVVGALVPGAFAGWLFVRGLGRIGSTRAAVLAYLEPLVAVVIGWTVWHERLAPISIVGGALVLGAGAWVTRARVAG
jgi:drug/metabolite transporter (DMT)-like permease